MQIERRSPFFATFRTSLLDLLERGPECAPGAREMFSRLTADPEISVLSRLDWESVHNTFRSSFPGVDRIWTCYKTIQNLSKKRCCSRNPCSYDDIQLEIPPECLDFPLDFHAQNGRSLTCEMVASKAILWASRGSSQLVSGVHQLWGIQMEIRSSAVSKTTKHTSDYGINFDIC